MVCTAVLFSATGKMQKEHHRLQLNIDAVPVRLGVADLNGERCKTKNVKRRNAETDGIDPGRTAEQGLPDFGGGEFPATFGLFGPRVRVV